ncbi:MAG: hypothetical protein KF775_18205 [Cyclobacteriaceae bacterium]|nr:hypothetical protein [Cytophagales bacterium]MBX2901590.1 hypothetical protein [Cyclobacteriaceae bacterium]
MKTYLVALALSVLLCAQGMAQSETTGIFATIKITKKHKAKDYGRRVSNRNHREVFLIPEKSLIALAEFTSVSATTHDLRTLTSYFSISVSKDGMARLRNTIIALPDTELILVIDNQVFGRISAKSEEDFKSNKITIASPFKDADLEWAQTTLSELLKPSEP